MKRGAGAPLHCFNEVLRGGSVALIFEKEERAEFLRRGSGMLHALTCIVMQEARDALSKLLKASSFLLVTNCTEET